MPANKDALRRYRIIDWLLADANHDYTTSDILNLVNRECGVKVTLRMVQKDVKALEEDFGKDMVRNKGGRGTVRYADQSEPLFYQELTPDEEEVLRELLKALGQFDGLENFSKLDLLRRRLNMGGEWDRQRPLISFDRNDILQVPPTLLGRLFTAISRKKVIRFTYTRFGLEGVETTVYPYQLRRYNDRWFLLATPVGNDTQPYDSGLIINYALDRISDRFDYVEEMQYIETPVDIEGRFDEVVGVTLLEDREVEQIYFAVRPVSVPYVRTKYIHPTQIELVGDDAETFREKWPSLKDCAFFSIECRPNYELYSRFASFGANLIVFEPTYIADAMKNMMKAASVNYEALDL